MSASQSALTSDDPAAATDGRKSLGNETLAPQKTRIMGRPSYFLAWFGGCVSIGTFAMGSSVVGTLNLIQATLAIAIGCFVIGIALALNGAAGYKYGIPFMVQARSAFGFAGTRLPGLVRAVPAIVWYGFQSWIGAGALNMVSATLFGFDNVVFFSSPSNCCRSLCRSPAFRASSGWRIWVAGSFCSRWSICLSPRSNVTAMRFPRIC